MNERRENQKGERKMERIIERDVGRKDRVTQVKERIEGNEKKRWREKREGV